MIYGVTQDQLDAAGVPAHSERICAGCGGSRSMGACVDFMDIAIGEQYDTDRLIELAKSGCSPAIAELRDEEDPDA